MIASVVLLGATLAPAPIPRVRPVAVAAPAQSPSAPIDPAVDPTVDPTIDVAPSAESLGIDPQPDGTFIYVDPARQFTLHIEPDGRVKIADRWRRPSVRSSDRGQCCARPPDGLARNLNPFVGLPHRGPAEWAVKDPYQHHKRVAMRHTESFRVGLAIAWAKRTIAARLRSLPDELAAVWSEDQGTRKTLLFEHWDACEDRLVSSDGLPRGAIVAIDRARAQAGERARAIILAFIRERAPAGSATAYTAAELRALNARRVSATRFDPYCEIASTGSATKK